MFDKGGMAAPSLLDRLKAWAWTFKRDVVALWLAARDSRVPLHAKLVAAVVAAYALSPIDLIPDFVPILGYLDDLIIVPFGILIAVKLIPLPIMTELRAKAAGAATPASMTGFLMIVLIWIGLGVALWRYW